MNIELLEQKEQLYEDYRQKITEFESTVQQCKDLESALRSAKSLSAKLENEVADLKHLIMYMITNDLDPVSAKLKYNENDPIHFSSPSFHSSVYATSASNLTDVLYIPGTV